MKPDFGGIIGTAFFLILVYLLVMHGPAVASIATSSAAGATNLIVALQGNAKQK